MCIRDRLYTQQYLPPNVSDCTPLGINELQEETTITISPNPFTSETTITFDKAAPRSIAVMNVLGSEVLRFALNDKSTTLDMSAVSKGIYFLQITSLDKLGMTNVINKKLVVQ